MLVARHRCVVAASDLDVVDGLSVTSLPRTLADVLRDAPRPTALAVTDAAFRQVAHDTASDTYDTAAADALQAAVAARLRPGARGVRQARELLELADGRAESPGESVSRLQLHDLGFARPRLQVPIPSPDDRVYRVDFGLDDAGVWGEYDGEVKYRDPAMRGGRTLEEIIRAEKEREDWIRGTTGRRIVRWTTADIRSPGDLRRKLSQFGVFPTPSHHRHAESPRRSAHSSGDSSREC